MTVDHLKMLHTAGGKGIPLQFSSGFAWSVWREQPAQPGIGAVPACFCFGGGESSVWLPASAPSTAHGFLNSEYITPVLFQLS